MPAQKKYFENLDGLRFALALVVFFSHSLFGEALQRICPSNFLDGVIEVFASGPLGVSFFFVLSGFLITYLMLEENDDTGRLKVGNFYVRRILRIWPIFYLTLIFSFFVYPFVKGLMGYSDQNPYSFVHQFFFLSNFDSIRIQRQHLIDVAPMMLNINWSIAIEEQFYALWPIIFLIAPGRKFWMCTVVVIAVSQAYRTWIADGAQLYYHTLSVISDFGVGGLASYLVFYSASFLSFLQRLKRWTILSVYVLGFALLMGQDIYFRFAFDTRLLVSLFFVFIILEQSFSNESFFKFGNWKAFSAMGKYTYAFYMFHPIGIQASIIFFRFMNFRREDSFILSMLYVAIALIGSLGFSIASYRYFERYFLQLRRRFY